MKAVCLQWVVRQWGDEKNENNNKISCYNPTNDCFLSAITGGEDNK